MIRSHHDVVTLLEHDVCATEVDVVGRQQLDAAVMVLFVVPAKERPAVSEPVGEVAQSAWEARVVFERLEMALREWVVVAGMGAAEALVDVEFGEQLRQELAAHWGAAVGVQGDAPGFHVVLCHRLFDEAGCERCIFALGEKPANHAPAIDVDDDVEIEVDELPLGQQLRDVPGPDLVGRRREELWLGVVRVHELVAALPGLTAPLQQPVQRALRAHVAVLLGERRDDLSRSPVLKTLVVQGIHGRLLLIWRQRANRLSSARRCPGFLPPVVGRRRQPQGVERRNDACSRENLSGGAHESLSSKSTVFSGIPNNEATFFWTSMMVSACASLRVSFAFSRCRRSTSSESGDRGNADGFVVVAWRPRRAAPSPSCSASGQPCS